MFEEGGKLKKWHKDLFIDGEFKLFGPMQKFKSELFQVGDFRFLPICLLVKMKRSIFQPLGLQFESHHQTDHKKTRRMRQYPKGLAMKRNWTSKFRSIAAAHAHFNLLHLEKYLLQPLTLQLLNLMLILFFSRVFSFVSLIS